MKTLPFTAWYFDSNYRVYIDENGIRTSSPIYEKHWREILITEETSRSWITQYGRKYPKKGDSSLVLEYSKVLDDVFIKQHQYRILDSIKSIKDAALLKTIADLIGYTYE